MGVSFVMKKATPTGRSSASVAPAHPSDAFYNCHSRTPCADGKWSIIEFGPLGSLHYRMLFIDGNGKEMSPWHNIPLYAEDHYLNFICKTPRGLWGEFEVAESEHCNPLRLKKRRGKPSHYNENVQWNVGMLPQTWSDPRHYNAEYGGLPYDNCPLEVIEIGARTSRTGEVYMVKSLAAFAVIDSSSKLSWKILAIAKEDPLAAMLNTFEDVKTVLPGMMEVVQEWFKTGHGCDGLARCAVYGPNEYDHTHFKVDPVIEEAHQAWQSLVEFKPPPEPWNIPLPRPLSASVYESLWKQYTLREAHVEISLSDTHSNNSVQYERAWAGSTPENADTVSSSASSDFSKCRSDSSDSLKTMKSGKSLKFRWPSWMNVKMQKFHDLASPTHASHSVKIPHESKADLCSKLDSYSRPESLLNSDSHSKPDAYPKPDLYSKADLYPKPDWYPRHDSYKLDSYSMNFTDTKPSSPMNRRKSFEFDKDVEAPQEAFSAVRCKTLSARFPSASPAYTQRSDLSPVFAPVDSKPTLPPHTLTWKKSYSKPLPRVTTTKSLLERLQLQSEMDGPMKVNTFDSTMVMHSGIPVGVSIDRYDDSGYFGLSRRNSL